MGGSGGHTPRDGLHPVAGISILFVLTKIPEIVMTKKRLITEEAEVLGVVVESRRGHQRQ